MKVRLHWSKKGEVFRKDVCRKYGLPMWETVNGFTPCEITPEVREMLRKGESNELFRVIES